ncbi:MAG TPA: hypothetical protein VMJ32_09245 [Pirellulales bacterium]|nr:hypothetical protein [Pirellulales bacterium]
MGFHEPLDAINWLDTQTKAQLQKSPPDKLAPPAVDGYSLVLLERGTDRERVYKTIEALADNPNKIISKCPVVVRQHLTLTDALEGQFELICTDSISIFLDDNIVRDGECEYLDDLYRNVRKSTEFEPVNIELRSIPNNESGKRFLRQFFGQVLGVPPKHTVTRKKARIMVHWGNKLGAVIESDAASNSQ